MPWAAKGRSLRLSTRIVISQLAVLLLVVALAFWLNFRIARDQLNQQYEQRALAVAQSVADMPQTVAALSGTGPSSVVQPITLRISHSTGAAFAVVVNRGGIRLSSPDPALVGKWFHERVVSLDGQDHLRIDPGKPAPSANARAPVFDAAGRVVGEVSVGFLERQVNAGAWSELPSAAAAAGFALLLGVAASLLLARRLKRITFGLELDEIARQLRKAEQLAAEQASLRRVATLVAVGMPQEDLFAAVAEEVGRLADADTAQVYRYQQDDSIVLGSGVGPRPRGSPARCHVPHRRTQRVHAGAGNRAASAHRRYGDAHGGAGVHSRSAESPLRRGQPDRGRRSSLGTDHGEHHPPRADGRGRRAAHRCLHRTGRHRDRQRSGPHGPGRFPDARGHRGRRNAAPDRAEPT